MASSTVKPNRIVSELFRLVLKYWERLALWRLCARVKVARNKSTSANQVALAWLLHRPFAVIPIVGTSRPEGAKEAAAAAEILLTQEELDLVSYE